MEGMLKEESGQMYVQNAIGLNDKQVNLLHGLVEIIISLVGII